MNKQSLKIARSCVDEVIAGVLYCQMHETYPGAGALDMWRSRLETARVELLEIAAPEEFRDVSGASSLCGSTGE